MPGIASPCVRNCCLDEEDICLGCLRSVEEIMQWGGADDELRRRILQRAEARRAQRLDASTSPPHRGGR